MYAEEPRQLHGEIIVSWASVPKQIRHVSVIGFENSGMG
jgi:hypothetical protein